MNELEKYQSIMKEFKRNTNDIKGVISQVKRASSALESWKTLSVEPSKIGYPMLPNHLDSSDYPKIERIDELLSKWHSLKLDLENQYMRLDNPEGIASPTDVLRDLNV